MSLTGSQRVDGNNSGNNIISNNSNSNTNKNTNNGKENGGGAGGAPLSDICAGCKRSGMNLLVCDDAAGDGSGTKARFCSNCMIGKKVRVFWPLDEQWYVGIVQKYDIDTGEHLLRYPDGDTEWVKIGENGPSAGTNISTDVGSPVGAGAGILRSRSRDMSDRSGPGGGPAPSSEAPQQAPPPPYNSHNGSMLSQLPHTPEIPQQQQPQQRKTEHTSSPDKQSRRNPYPDQNQPNIPPDQNHNPSIPRTHPSHYQPGMHPYPAPYPGMGGHPPPNMPPPPYGPPYSGQPGGYPPPGLPYAYPPPMHIINPSSSPNDDKRNGKNNLESPHPNMVPIPTQPNNNGSGSKRKSGPKTWTKEEDGLLLNMVQSMRMPMKWSLVAQSMPDRTGKQCRERYVNHLNPRLKSTDWSPSEDAKIFHLYNTCGSQWAKMSKMIPGRTDNGIKNRFHNLRRQLEREDEHRVRLSKPQDFPDQIRLERLRMFPDHLRGKCDELWDMSNGIGVLAAQSVVGGSFARNAGRFGPFKMADKGGEQCARCGLFAPSTQCGYEICTRSKWCQACTRIPPHMCNSLLRECLNLRRSQETEKGKIEESWDEEMKTD